MKHKQYKQWILDETPLNSQQKKELNNHMRSCHSCRALHAGWSASKKMITRATLHSPAPGFSSRWQQTVIKKKQIEKVRRYRLSMLALVLLAFAGTVAYLVLSGSVMQYFANGLAMISDLIIKTTSGLSSIGYWLRGVPIAVPITIGFVFFGFLSSFFLVGIFFLWNMKQRKLQTNEIHIN